MSSATSSRTNQKRTTCHICCEEKAAKVMVSLTACSHKQCKECLRKWIQRSEAAGDATCPGCPYCRVEITKKDIRAILGRPYCPVAASASTTNTADLDDLTLQWLQEQTKPCPQCGALISKEEDTCAKMECLCGYRFCYDCGAQGAQCSCSPANHVFAENSARFKREQRYRMSTCRSVETRILAARNQRLVAASYERRGRDACDNRSNNTLVDKAPEKLILRSNRNEAVGKALVTADAVRKEIQAWDSEISMKDLKKAFDISRRSTPDRISRFQNAIQHLCTVKKESCGRVLVLKPCFQEETPTGTYAIRVRWAVHAGLQWSELGM